LTKTLSNADIKTAFVVTSQALTPPGREYVVDGENRAVINNVLYYFNSDPVFEGDLGRGLFIRGNIGSGKTHLLEVFKTIGLRAFVLFKTRLAEREVAIKGHEYLKTLNRATDMGFDDLGAEANIKSYGNEVNVMAEVIQDRYDLWKKTGAVTHFTTNLTNPEIISRYGDRCLSRLMEMSNFITLGVGAHSKDRRIV